MLNDLIDELHECLSLFSEGFTIAETTYTTYTIEISCDQNLNNFRVHIYDLTRDDLLDFIPDFNEHWEASCAVNEHAMDVIVHEILKFIILNENNS